MNRSAGGELFIVDNSDADWKVARYLREWAPLARQLDVATGYFEIGGLLAIGDPWSQIDRVRLLMGDEVSLRTKRAFEAGLEAAKDTLDRSLESEKRGNDFLTGVPRIVEGIRSGQIECRVYRKDRFHAKAYITHARSEVVGSFALVGSSNLTTPGLTQNVELNTRFGGAEVALLQEWYERHWADAEDVTAEILRVLERHTREFSPFEVYAQSLHHLFRDAPSSEKDWETRPPEQGGSEVFKVLDRYQQDGYRNLVQIAENWGGAFLCDGVGLGKTFIGMMLLERLVVRDRKRVALIVPKSGRKAVWEAAIQQFCPDLLDPSFNNLEIINHTDITREPSGDRNWPRVMETIRSKVDAVVIDEAHHFRNPGVQVDVEPGSGKLVARDGKRPSRYRRLFQMLEPVIGRKEVYLLTATPVNNHINDLRHMIELFSRRQDDRFASIGINSLRGHFNKLEKAIDRRAQEQRGSTDASTFTDAAEAEEVLEQDRLFRELVVQRSRAYVRESQQVQHGKSAVFPIREDPIVADYNVRKVYGALLDAIEKAFSKKAPLFRLAIYNPAEYARKKDESKEAKIEANRQLQVIGLVRTNFLKRFESSAQAFESSCERLLLKLLAWMQLHATSPHERDRLAKWKHKYEKLLGRVSEHQDFADRHQRQLFGDDEPEEDVVPPELLQEVVVLSRNEYDIDAMLDDTIDDLTELCGFLEQLQKFTPAHDDKLQKLVRLLKSDKELKGKKVLIFSEFADTASYLGEQLRDSGIDGLEVIDGKTSPDGRLDVIRRFAPYYNGTTSPKLAATHQDAVRVLISTDVLSEGLNLQDATRLINYDLHWNPVRLMQRIGRVDRRLNPAVETQMLADHPKLKGERGRIVYWNFLPPDDLDVLLRLYERVSRKTLRISKVFGIEGRKLLTDRDDFDALRDLNAKYEGTATAREALRLEYEKLLTDHPDLDQQLDALPGRIFSGREADSETTLTGAALFCCYALPGKVSDAPEDAPIAEAWTEQAGETRWYLLTLGTGEILEGDAQIAAHIRSTPDTPRVCRQEQSNLIEARKLVEKHIHRTYEKAVNLPAGLKPRLIAWMELN